MKILNDFDECMHKLRYIERAKTDTELAQALNMPLGTFGDHKKRKELPVEHLLTYCEKRCLDIDWLILKKSA